MRNRNIRTTLSLKLINHSETLSFEIAKLNYNASSYRFIVKSQQQPIKIELRFCHAYIAWIERLHVHNLGLDCHVSLEDLQINYFKAKKIRRLTTRPHAVTINVYAQTRELIEVIILYNGLKSDDEIAGVSSSEQHKLYPELPAY